MPRARARPGASRGLGTQSARGRSALSSRLGMTKAAASARRRLAKRSATCHRRRAAPCRRRAVPRCVGRSGQCIGRNGHSIARRRRDVARNALRQVVQLLVLLRPRSSARRARMRSAHAARLRVRRWSSLRRGAPRSSRASQAAFPREVASRTSQACLARDVSPTLRPLPTRKPGRGLVAHEVRTLASNSMSSLTWMLSSERTADLISRRRPPSARGPTRLSNFAPTSSHVNGWLENPG
jgi:hypothetical protein